MFTGIIQAIGTLSSLSNTGGDLSISIATGDLDMSGTAVGDSIAVNGVCLTVTRIEEGRFHSDVSGETVSVTTLGELSNGSPVNLEPALRIGDPLGGHLVTGHIDGVGKVVRRHDDGRSVRMQFRVPGNLNRFVAVKGAICVDGVSLTVNETDENLFAVNLIPHTLSCTILDAYRAGTRINLEVDLLARYTARLLETAGQDTDKVTDAALDEETLRKYGYTGNT